MRGGCGSSRSKPWTSSATRCSKQAAREALELIDKQPDISLLFTDIVMPDMGGAKLANEAPCGGPSLLVLFTTGFARNAVVHNGVLDAGVDLLAKPFVMEDLAEKIHHILI